MQGALGDPIKDGNDVIPPPNLRAAASNRVNITALDDAPVIGRRVSLSCSLAYSDRKMACPLGPNDPIPERSPARVPRPCPARVTVHGGARVARAARLLS